FLTTSNHQNAISTIEPSMVSGRILLMKHLFKFITLSLSSLFLTLFISSPAMAYVGPGAGLVAIAAFIALGVAVLAALLGFLWFPLKRILSKRNQTISSKDQVNEEIQK
ncbi:MAG: hypothetical protein AAGA80_04865, partial [Cyanobacteria bacterium P01_F01_bin.143]